MPEVVRIALEQFVDIGLFVAIAYGAYRLIAFVGTRVIRRFSGGRNETWDGIQLLYRVPASILGFIALDLVIIVIVSSLVSGFGKRHFGYFTKEFTDFFWVLGIVGIFGATVFGIYRDEPTERFKLLVVVAVFSGLIGMALG